MPPITLNDFLEDAQPNLELIKIDADNNTYYWRTACHARRRHGITKEKGYYGR